MNNRNEVLEKLVYIGVDLHLFTCVRFLSVVWRRKFLFN
jgi:hypothetical protein